MRLDTDSLRNLRAIVESGSFTGAASRLHLTQSAVSRKIKRLEERLGHALLVRNGKTIEPTQMGHELLAHAERILAAHDDAVASLKLRELTGTVRLGCNDEPQIGQVADIISGTGVIAAVEAGLGVAVLNEKQPVTANSAIRGEELGLPEGLPEEDPEQGK